MDRCITKAQLRKLEDARVFGMDDEFHALLKKYIGIEARAYTAYNYYDENGDFIGNSDDCFLQDLLEKAIVEVRDD